MKFLPLHSVDGIGVTSVEFRQKVLGEPAAFKRQETSYLHPTADLQGASAMDIHLAEELLDELIPSLESAEAQSAAILQFLKDTGMATDEQLAPYLEQAGNASNVRWRAARLRINRLLSAIGKSAEDASKKKEEAAEEKKKKEKPAEEKTAPQKTAPESRQREKDPYRKEDQAGSSKVEKATEAGQRQSKSTEAESEERSAAQTDTRHAESKQAKSDQEKPGIQKETSATGKSEKAGEARGENQKPAELRTKKAGEGEHERSTGVTNQPDSQRAKADRENPERQQAASDPGKSEKLTQPDRTRHTSDKKGAA
jgi:hypothetical protein